MFVMTSPAEMQSITMLEAMASGLPIAAVHAGALPELCQDGKNGRLFNTDDASELSNLMLEMLADPKRLKTMATVSRQIAVSHSFDKTQKAFTSLYEELLSQSEV